MSVFGFVPLMSGWVATRFRILFCKRDTRCWHYQHAHVRYSLASHEVEGILLQ